MPEWESMHETTVVVMKFMRTCRTLTVGNPKRTNALTVMVKLTALEALDAGKE